MCTLVTGATGMVGHGVVAELLTRGHDVRALVRDPERARTIVAPEVELVRGDLTEPDTLGPAMAGVDWVFHAAGMPEQWQRDPGVFDRVNHHGTVNVLEAARRAAVSRVVYTSTLDVFRTDADGVLRETQPDPDPKPTHYERSKQAAAREVARFVAEGLDVVSVNPGSVYGPSPTRTGMSEMFVKILRGQAPLLPPGGFSVVYVDGVGRAQVAAAERGGTGQEYLLADAYISAKEFGGMIAEAARRRKPGTAPVWLMKGLAATLEPLARTFGFTPLIAKGQLSFLLWQANVDATKARTELGFTPTPLDEGVARTVEHFRSVLP
jgi:dihydroflavonol-4-reductase